MKIIHTSDWHLGQTFYDYDRSEEQRDMLRQIVAVVNEEQPDALVISGDIYHTGNPHTSAVKMYNTALLQMHRACPDMHIVVTAGNHDSAARLTVNNDLWDYFKVSVLGLVAKNHFDRSPDYDKHIVWITGNDQRPVGIIAAVPHCYESNFPAVDPDMQRDERVAAYFSGLLDRIKEINHDGAPVVLMAHLAVSGCDLSGHESIGGMETREVSVFGDGYDYIALGHIHTPQNITDRVRYCGTPIPVNFGERFEHSVSVVTVNHGEKPIVRTRPIKNLIPLHDLPSVPKPFGEVLSLINEYPSSERCYLRLLVEADQSMTPLADTIVGEAVRDKLCRVCRIQLSYKNDKSPTKAKAHKAITRGDLQSMTPLEVAELLFDMKGIELTDPLREIIKQATIEADNIKKGDDNEA